MKALDLPTLEDNLRRVRVRIDRAAEASGRQPGQVQIMAVTKTHPAETVALAVQAGLELLGENRVQEADGKYSALLAGPSGTGGASASRISLHLIGHLQRNKARTASTLFECVQSIDRYETAEALARYCGAAGRSMDVLLELNTSGEDSKFGFGVEEDLLRELERIVGLETLRVRGLMTVGPFTEDSQRIRIAFVRLRELFQRLKGVYPQLAFDTLSMGMSGDFEIAVEEGATMVRLGTVLFGPRDV